MTIPQKIMGEITQLKTDLSTQHNLVDKARGAYFIGAVLASSALAAYQGFVGVGAEGPMNGTHAVLALSNIVAQTMATKCYDKDGSAIDAAVLTLAAQEFLPLCAMGIGAIARGITQRYC